MSKLQNYLKKKKIQEMNLPKIYVVHSTREGVVPPVEKQVIEIIEGHGKIYTSLQNRVPIPIYRYKLNGEKYPYEVDIARDEKSSFEEQHGSGMGDLWAYTYYSSLSESDANQWYEKELQRITKKYLKNETMELSTEKIKEINESLLPEFAGGQGIYTQPYGIPVHIKEPVIYIRFETGGKTGGSYHENSYARHYIVDECERPKFQVLDTVLKELMPSLSFLQFREVEELIHTNEETEYEYYGNSTDYEIKYIILPELINLLKTFK